MSFITTRQELQEYKERIERQKEVLILSPIFTETEKIELADCYKKLATICQERLNKKG